MSSITLAELIKTALIITSNIKLRIRCITYDADSINISVFKILGCNVIPSNHKDIINLFIHPNDNYKICYFRYMSHAEIS